MDKSKNTPPQNSPNSQKAKSEAKSSASTEANKSKAIAKNAATSGSGKSSGKSSARNLNAEKESSQTLKRELVPYGKGERESRGRARMLRTSPQKLNDVARTIRQKPVETAMQELRFSKRRIATAVLKLLRSVVANAENNKQLDVDRLVVKQAWVGKSARLRRFAPRAKGRSSMIIKEFSAITIIVEEVDEKA